MKGKVAIAILGLGLLVGACKIDTPEWQSGYLIPLVKTSISISEIVNDSLLVENTDNTISLVYRQEIARLRLDTLAAIPATTFSKNVKLSSLELPDETFNRTISLGLIAQNWPVWGPIIIGQNGNYVVLPDVTGITSGPFPIDVQNFFQTATLQSGWMDFSITNNFPVDIANVQFEIRNVNSGTVVVNHSFPFIAQGTTATDSVDVSGKTIEGLLEVEILNLDILGNNDSLLVDTSDFLNVTIGIRDLQIFSATAVFPAQNVVDEKISTKLDLGDVKLKKAFLKSGIVRIDVVSTAQDTIFFNYKIPGATKGGVPFEANTKVMPATSTTSSTATFLYDFTGYDLDLTGEFGTESNIIYNELTGRIDSTGKIVTLSLDDSLSVSLSIHGLEPSYAEGFLGSEQFLIGPDKIAFDVFKDVVSGSIALENVKSSMSVESTMGIAGEITLKKLIASNSKTTQSVALTSALINNPIAVNRATDNPLIPSFTSIDIDNSNSNVTSLFEILPDQLEYELEVYINKGIDTLNTDFMDFAYDTSEINSSVDIEIPLSMVATELKLVDTIDISQDTKFQIQGVKDGKINLLADNGFPIEAEIELHFISAKGNVQYVMYDPERIKPAPVSGGRVTTPMRTILSYEIGENVINRILNSESVAVTATFNTADQNNPLKIYSDYDLGITLTGDFNYANK